MVPERRARRKPREERTRQAVQGYPLLISMPDAKKEAHVLLTPVFILCSLNDKTVNDY